MKYKLLERSTIQLLQDFGAGKASPGSGSASSLLGLVSAEMILTVCEISLTKEVCKEYHDRFKEISSFLNEKIIPQLAQLFEKDAEDFDRVVLLRKERDKSNNTKIREEYDEESLALLEVATDYTFNIADHSLLLAEYGVVIFENGWQTVRGDSGVAISSAVSSLMSSIFVINLNLKTLNARRYAKNNLKRCQNLEAKLKDLQKRSIMCVQSISNESMEAIADNFAISKMESKANRIHEKMFNSTNPEWESDFSTDFINILEPSLAVSTLGYNLDYIESLDYLTKDPKTKIAGVINTKEKKIWISNAFKGDEKRFTLAHEIGHAVMHKGMDMHRDRPVDGSNRSKAKRGYREYEADQFAVYFLMPEDYLRRRFKQLFLTDCFSITDDILSVLDKKVSQKVQTTQNLRELTRVIAEVRVFNTQNFNPLTKQFGVSIEAMAIRLEELELVKFIKD